MQLLTKNDLFRFQSYDHGAQTHIPAMRQHI